MSSHILVLDANILVRAVLGSNVKNHLLTSGDQVDFFTPDICVEEVERHLPVIFKKRGISPELSLEVFSNIKLLLQIIDKDIYQARIVEAQQRIKDRDMHDWPVIATALLFNCPIWTEDNDFFGVGIPVWTTNRIHLFFDAMRREKVTE